MFKVDNLKKPDVSIIALWDIIRLYEKMIEFVDLSVYF